MREVIARVAVERQSTPQTRRNGRMSSPDTKHHIDLAAALHMDSIQLGGGIHREYKSCDERDQYLDRKLSSERFSYSSCAGRSCNLAEEYGSISDRRESKSMRTHPSRTWLFPDTPPADAFPG